MLKDKTIVVIGATGGIGRVLSKSFAAAGANLVISARTEEKLLALKRDLSEKVLALPADASRLEDVERIFSEAQREFDTIDAVVIAAGTWKRLSINDPSEEAVELARSHFNALFLPALAVGFVAEKFFRKKGHGLIVNISSHAAIRPELPGNLTYGPMKAAARHFMLALREELKGSNVRVTDLMPAIVNTPEAALLLDTEEKRAQAVQPETIAEWIIENFDNPNIPDSKLFESEVLV